MFKFNKLIALFLASLSASCYTSDYFRVSEYEKACRILGVSEKSSIQEIKKAYRNKAKIVHPDAGGTKESFQQIGSAYEYLNEHFDRYSHSLKNIDSGSSFYAGNTPTGSSYGSGSSYDCSQSNSYTSNSNTSNNSGVNNTPSAPNPKKSIFGKIKGRYLAGAACCFGLYKYMNPKKTVVTNESRLNDKENLPEVSNESRLNDKENLPEVSKYHFFKKFSDTATHYPVASLSAIAAVSVFGYFLYQKYMKKDAQEEALK